MHISREDFEMIVAHAVEEIPGEFRKRIENVEIVVEDEPLPEHFGVAELPPDVIFFGLYHGVPTPHRGFYNFALPDRILIFKGPIERYCRTRKQLIDQIRKTVRHEVAHYFGISDERLREIIAAYNYLKSAGFC